MRQKLRLFLAVRMAVEVNVERISENGRGVNAAAPGAAQREYAVGDLHFAFSLPAEGRFAVEEQEPAVGDFLRRQRVRFGLVGGPRREGECQEQNHRGKMVSHGAETPSWGKEAGCRV